MAGPSSLVRPFLQGPPFDRQNALQGQTRVSAVPLEVEKDVGLDRRHVVPGDPGVHGGLGHLRRPAQGGPQGLKAIIHRQAPSASPKGQGC